MNTGWDWNTMWPVLQLGLKQTGTMIGLAIVPTVILGMAIGVLLVSTERDGILAAPFGSARFGRGLHLVIDFFVNIGRSLPFLILMVLIIPFTRLLVGSFIGPVAAAVPLAVAAIPFFARLVELSLREVDKGLIEAAKSLGATRRTIVWKVLLAEGRPGIVLGFSTSVISLLNYSSIAGAVGGGGIGDIAYRYGYQRYDTAYLVATVIILVIIVQVVQVVLSAIARRLTHR